MKINRALAIAAVALLPLVTGATFAASNAPAQFKDECHCVGCHAQYRWDVKTDDEAAPQSVSNTISPSDIGAWHGRGEFSQKTRRAKAKKSDGTQ